MNEPIGGFFGLEAARGTGLHPEAYRFATASGALQHYLVGIAREAGTKTIWLPQFLCPEVERAVARAGGCTIKRYAIDSSLQPVELEPGADELVYICDLFGLGGARDRVSHAGLILDNAHAFFRPAEADCVTLYSARKFFGVPDGAYLYSDRVLEVPPPASSTRGFAHLTGRIADGPQEAYPLFRAAEAELAEMPPAGMSAIAQHILAGIDYAGVRLARLENFRFLHRALGASNELSEPIERALRSEGFVPFSYPWLVSGGRRRRAELIARKVFVPHLWEGIGQASEFEARLAADTVHLPVDQRYDLGDMADMLARVERTA